MAAVLVGEEGAFGVEVRCEGHLFFSRRDSRKRGNSADGGGASWVSRVRVEYRPRSSVLFYSLHFG